MKISVSAIQFSMEEDNSNNINKSIYYINQSYISGANIVVLPELFQNKYFCQNKDSSFLKYSISINDSLIEKYQDIAKKNKQVIIFPFFEKDNNSYYNSVLVISSQGQIIDLYRKIHIPNGPQYYEKFYFSSGNLGFKSINTEFGKIGVLICYDQWFPEAARACAINGADIICIPTAIGWDINDEDHIKQKELDAWVTIQRSHSIANTVPIISSNRTGKEYYGKSCIEFWGNSFISDSFGKILTQLSCTYEGVCTSIIDLNENKKIRKVWPFLEERMTTKY